MLGLALARVAAPHAQPQEEPTAAQQGDDGRAAIGDPLAQDVRRSLGGHQDEPPGDRIGLGGLQVAAHAGEQQLARVALGQVRGEDLRKLGQRPRALALDERLEQALQVAEVAVDDRPRDAGLPRHGLDRYGVEAALGDDPLGGVEQLLAPLLGGHAG